MEVLILGGTGAMGIHLIECLVAKGIFVTVTSRKDRDSAEYVTYVKGNAHDVNFLTTLLERKRWDVIVDFMVYSTEEFRPCRTFIKINEAIYISQFSTGVCRFQRGNHGRFFASFGCFTG